jgi:hypothetical protein
MNTNVLIVLWPETLRPWGGEAFVDAGRTRIDPHPPADVDGAPKCVFVFLGYRYLPAAEATEHLFAPEGAST